MLGIAQSRGFSRRRAFILLLSGAAASTIFTGGEAPLMAR